MTNTEQPNPRMRAAIMEILDNQLASNDPPETKETLVRLLASGQDEEEARRLIACAIFAEIFDVMKHQRSFDRERFVTRLHGLPDTSFLKAPTD